MAIDNYDDSFETYDAADIAAATPTTAYVNKQVQNIDQTKQNAIVLQPTNPPLNPKIGDMWIDTNIFPNVIYSWDGSQWNRATATAASEVGAYTTAQVDTQMNNVQMNNSALQSRVSTVEQKTTSDAIVTTITSSQDWATKMNITDADAKYATQSALTQQSNQWNQQFSSSGGINLLKNSTGYAYNPSSGFGNWQVTSGSFSQYIGNDCLDTGTGFTATTGTMKQAVAAVAGQPYTITCKVKKGTAGTGYLKISDGANFQEIDLASTAAYNYTTIQYAGFVPKNNTIIIELNANGVTGGLIFTALMLNVGSLGLQWCNALGELYNTNVKLDINGIQVFSNQYNGYTVMSPSEFSGYYQNSQGNMQRVFTLNKDTTQVAKLAINDPTQPELDMGSLKMIYVNSGGYNGWAIVPS